MKKRKKKIQQYLKNCYRSISEEPKEAKRKCG